MGKSATKAKNKYNDANYDRIALTVPKGQKEELKEFAVGCGYKSVNQFIVDAIESYKEAIVRERNDSE